MNCLFRPTLWQSKLYRANVFIIKQFVCDKKAYETDIMRVLNVAEKNDASRSLSEILSGGRYKRREGFSVYNKIYEFEYQLFNRRAKMVMTSVSGHLMNLDFVGSYRKWSGCNPLALFDAPVVMECIEDYKKIKQTLEREIRVADTLIIWTDGDREGENIGFEIIDVCKNVKPSVQVFRARFSEITSRAVTQACQSLGPPKKEISDAVNVRRELDLRIGAAFTRFQTLRLKRVFPQFLENQLVSYGSCQFPTLGFVVERYKQVQSFIPEPFWKIKVSHMKDNVSTDFSWKRGRLFDHTACLALYQLCLEVPTAIATDLKSKNKTKWRPLPLDTVEMEKLASRKLRINAKETMKIAEKLYTQGYISYPRTETNIFPKGLNLVPLVEMQANDPNWGAFASRVLTEGPNPRQGNKTDSAHPPIHPTKYVSHLQGNEKRIYEFIVRHFLACISKDAEGKETTLEIEINGEKFSVSGLMIIARNYLDVYPYDKWNAKVAPEYALGERFQPDSIEMLDGETSPPALLTEADLIALMDKHGIGTDATHAEHIETIKQRLYVGLNEDQKFVPGQLGMGLVEGYDAMGFEMSKPYLRAELEADLKRICEGSKDPNAVLREQLQKYQDVFSRSFSQAIKLDEALSQYLGRAELVVPDEYEDFCQPVMKCPKCHSSDIILKRKRDGIGYFLSCMAYPHCNASMWLPDCIQEVSVSDESCDECQSGHIKKLRFKFKRATLAPLYPDIYVGCIGGCDRNFLEALGVRPILSTVQRQSTVSSFSLSQPAFASDGGHNHREPVLSPQTSTRQPLRQVTNSTQHNSIRSTASDNVDVVCHCGDSAVLLTVRKEGGNAGRQFYKCPRPSGNQCNFFMWHESRPSSFTSNQVNRNVSDNGLEDRNAVKCSCPAPAKLLTVTKEGPNQGRQFYACAKPREKGCNFFLWASSENGGNSQSTLPSALPRNGCCLNPSKRSCQNSDGTKRKRKCGICGEEGHNRKSCPQVK